MDNRLDDAEHRTRARSNTNTFAGFGWRRPPPPTPTVTTLAVPSLKVQSIEGLIEDLTPPSVPSLNYARYLSGLLPSASPCPALHAITPILGSLCARGSPSSLQAAGFEILAAYCSNPASSALSSTDVLACFALFRVPWSIDLWEPRFRAFIAFSDAVPHKDTFTSESLSLVKFWIKSAFDPILAPYPLQPTESVERQRSLDDYIALLVSLFQKSDPITNPFEEEVEDVMHYLGNMVHLGILQTTEQNLSPISPSPPQDRSPRRIPHRRNQSSASIPTLSSPASIRHPADIAVNAYLLYLSTQLKNLSYKYLDIILPLLFRALAFYASPLPRLSLNPLPDQYSQVEKQICSLLDSLFAGSHSTSCSLILKRNLSPNFKDDQNPVCSFQLSIGAYRTLHTFMRRGLLTRLARNYVGRASTSYTPSGAPSQMDLSPDVIKLAWPKEDLSAWDLPKVHHVLCRSVKEWVQWEPDQTTVEHAVMRDQILTEAAGIVNDVLQALDDQVDEDVVDEEESTAAGRVLMELVAYLHLWQNPDGSPFVIPRSHPSDVDIPLLRTLSFMLSRDLTLPMNSFVPGVLLSIAENLPDSDTVQSIEAMAKRHCFSPTSPDWMENWTSILTNQALHLASKPMTRRAIMSVLRSVHASVKDIPMYRKTLFDAIFGFWRQRDASKMEEDDVVWLILGEEVVLRITEASYDSSEDPVIEEILVFLTDAATSIPCNDKPEETHPASQSSLTQTALVSGAHTPISSPLASRIQSSTRNQNRDRENPMPSVMSLFTSLATGNSSRSQSQQPRQEEEPEIPEQKSPPLIEERPTRTSAVGAVIALVLIFSHLVFTSQPIAPTNSLLAIRLYDILIQTLSISSCPRARICALQFFFRLRADRDHKLYYASEDYDRDGRVVALAELIKRSPSSSEDSGTSKDADFRRSRPRVSERGPAGLSRADTHRSSSASGRSRSRAPGTGNLHSPISQTPIKSNTPLWRLPESPPFTLPLVGCVSEGLSSYDPTSPNNENVLPLSRYLSTITNMLEEGMDWEALSYILCHLPTQLANKHFFCGPKCRTLMVKLLKVLCAGISQGKLAANVENWPEGLKQRDAHGLAYHSISVLVSYKPCFDGQLLHALVEVLLEGLSGQPSTVKCCLQALSLCAFELQPSMRKYLPKILEKLSQIMSNAAMAIHIIDFLSIVGSIQTLHANFTEADFKMVFGVALQYLQQNNRPDPTQKISWALSQHTRVMSHYIIYVWFLAVRLSDRPRHIPFITRQLLLANEGNDVVDQPTEVCFDWLARYTYATADPRPANSFLSDTVTEGQNTGQAAAISEKTWLVGNSIVTIRALLKLGWIEVLSRRASGMTKFLCRVENVPMVAPGDVNPDLLSLPASLMLDRAGQSTTDLLETAIERLKDDEEDEAEESRPNPITGYVWSGSAPSQRRKDVVVDPSYFALQLSPYPDHLRPSRGILITDTAQLKSLFRSLDLTPVIDTHKVGIMYVAPGQKTEGEILRNTHGSPAYTRFLEGIGRLINLRGQLDVYAGGLDPDEDGEYAYAWWDDNSQILYHTATLMPNNPHDDSCTNKKSHIGNDRVRIVWNDSGRPYRFDTLTTQFQFVNIVIEPHSRGAVAAFSDNVHENEYFKVTVQRAPGMTEFTPIGEFKVISAENLSLLVRQLSLLSDWFASVFQTTKQDTEKIEVITNWRHRLDIIQRFKEKVAPSLQPVAPTDDGDILSQESFRDFSTSY